MCVAGVDKMVLPDALERPFPGPRLFGGGEKRGRKKEKERESLRRFKPDDGGEAAAGAVVDGEVDEAVGALADFADAGVAG